MSGAALELRPGVPDPEAVRSAADDADRAGGRPGRGRLGRRARARWPTCEAYRAKLQTFVYASGTTMKPIFSVAKRAARKSVAFAEGEDRRVLRAVQVVVDEGLARPWLVGRAEHHQGTHREARPAPAAGQRLRRRQHRRRPALPRLLADLPPPDRAQGRDRAVRQGRDAAAPDADRQHAALQGRGRRHDLRHLGYDRAAPGARRPGHRTARRRAAPTPA